MGAPGPFSKEPFPIISQAAMPLPGRTLAQAQRSARPVRGDTGHLAYEDRQARGNCGGNWAG